MSGDSGHANLGRVDLDVEQPRSAA
jgi:hypothetical protein